MSRKQRRLLPLLFLAVPAFAIAGLIVLVILSRKPGDVGLVQGSLAPCPDKPNCVCSRDTEEPHAIEPFGLGFDDPEAAFAELVEVAGGLDGARLITSEPGYAHFAVTTPVLRFIDDVELELDSAGARAHVRSASRVGHSDLGANRKRVEALRGLWNANRNALNEPAGN